MKLYIEHTVNPKVLKSLITLLDEKALDYELIDKTAIPVTLPDDKVIAVGSADFLEGFKRCEFNDDTHLHALHLVLNGERLNPKGFPYPERTEFQRVPQKKREATQALTTLTTVLKPCVIKVETFINLSPGTHTSLTDYARSKGLSLDVQRNLTNYDSGVLVDDIPNTEMTHSGEYLIRVPKYRAVTVNTIIKHIIDTASGQRSALTWGQ